MSANAIAAALRGGRRLYEFARNAMSYLEEHYRKERSEAGFRVDKKFFGCGVTCRREREERGVEGRCSASGSDATCSTRSSARIPFHRPQNP
ncbi:MAG: hypothetical protein C0167_02630 [Nitrososphaera sp.]|nr:MAG: hypothetical protein C0167_02630 [Nitrososphaera sp.]